MKKVLLCTLSSLWRSWLDSRQRTTPATEFFCYRKSVQGEHSLLRVCFTTVAQCFEVHARSSRERTQEWVRNSPISCLLNSLFRKLYLKSRQCSRTSPNGYRPFRHKSGYLQPHNIRRPWLRINNHTACGQRSRRYLCTPGGLRCNVQR